MVHMCKRIISPGFFAFSPDFNFQDQYWLKGQKIAQNDKKLCLSHSISQESYLKKITHNWVSCTKSVPKALKKIDFQKPENQIFSQLFL